MTVQPFLGFCHRAASVGTARPNVVSASVPLVVQSVLGKPLLLHFRLGEAWQAWTIVQTLMDPMPIGADSLSGIPNFGMTVA